MKFILATSNQHKAQEFQELFLGSHHEITAAEFKIDVEETGSTYNENAYLKAKAYYDQFKAPILADDSGLNVASLPGELGIYSARFGGEQLTDKERALLLLTKLQGIENRSAFFSCILCLYLSPKEIFYFEGRLAGDIANQYLGEKGFGYDPVFVPQTLDRNKNLKTLAELADWKKAHSHRALAFSHLLNFLKYR